jgi:hypothetical protein
LAKFAFRPGSLATAFTLIVVVAAPSGCGMLAPLDGLTGASLDVGDGGGALGTPGDDAGRELDPDGGPSADASLDATPWSDSGRPAGDGGSSSGGGGAPGDSGSGGVDARAPGNDAGAGGNDAGGPPPPVGYCAGLSPAPLFCEDFDEGTLGPWDQVSGMNGWAALDATLSLSAPDAMRDQVNANASAGNVDVAGYRTFDLLQGVAGRYTLTFAFRADSVDTSSSSDAVLGAIQLWNGSAAWDLELEVSYSPSTGNLSAYLSEDSATDYVEHPAAKPIAMKKWVTVAISITLPASGGTAPATMSFDGTQVVAATVNVPIPDPIPEIIVGPTYATPAPSGWTLRYDNVTFD